MTSLAIVLSCLCFYVHYAVTVNLRLNENDVCKKDGSAEWRCQRYTTCKTAGEAFRRGQQLDLCGVKRGSAVICCPPESRTPTNRQPSMFPPGVLSEAMCEYYSGLVCEEVPSISFFSSESLHRDTCSTPKPLISGGIDATAGEFPHMAQIGYGPEGDNDWACGGSVISERFVLSAAHCKENQKGGKITPATQVRLGDYNIATRNEEGSAEAIYRIAEIIIHPEYKTGESAGYHDIMLLRLDRNVTFGQFVRPLCLHRSHEIQAANITATGWGLKETTGPVADILQKVNISLINTDECQPHFRTALLTININDTTAFCAGDRLGLRDTCKGDSGGPLQIKLTRPYCMWSQVGITSKGTAFCGEKDPAIYTKVSYYVPWIEYIVWGNITQLPKKEPLKC